MNLHPICFKLEHSSVETIGMIQKAAAMGNLWLAASSRQHTVHASRLLQRFLAKHQITQVTQLHYSSDLTPWNFWIFPKLKLPLKGKRFQTVNEIQENMAGQLTVTGGTVVRSQGAYFEGDWGIIVLCTMFPVSCIFSNKCLYFSYYMAGYLLDRTHISKGRALCIALTHRPLEL